MTCRTCEFWKDCRTTAVLYAGKGQCIRYYRGEPKLKVFVPGDEFSTLFTDSDFGCVQWEERK